MLRTTFLVVLLLPTLAFAQHPKYDTYTGFAVDTTPVLPAAEVHPSLYFTADFIPTLRTRKEDRDSHFFDLWIQFRGDALSYIDDDMAELDQNDRPQATKTLAFWWLVEQDTTALEQAIAGLLLAFEGVPQTGEKPYDEINRATWLQNYAAAYDWVYEHLTPEQDAEIRARIAGEAQYLRDNLTDGEGLAPRPHNHRSKPAWAIGTAALALAEHPNAADWLQYALEASNTVTRYQFSADGIYREGAHYYIYNAVNLIPFLWHYKNVSGVDLFDEFQPTFEWPIRTRTGRGWMPNLEDGYLKPAPTHMVAAAYHGKPTALHDTADFAEVAQWNFEQTDFFTRDYTGATVDVTWEIDEYILYDPSIPTAAPTVPPTQFLDGGQVVFRNAWTRGPGDRYLLFQGVAEADNHNHPDNLSYFIAGNDAILAPDAGYGPSGFSDDRRNSWYLTAKAHNIVTADGYPPIADSLWSSPFIHNVTPPTHHFIDTPYFDFADKESKYLRPNGAVHRRAIGFVGEDYFVVADQLTGEASHTWRAYIHGRGVFVRNDHHAYWRIWANNFGEEARLDAFVFPTTATVTDQSGYISLFKDERREQYVEATQDGERARFLQILVPGPSDGSAPATSDLSTADYAAAEVVKDGHTDTFFLQHDNATHSLAAFTTDAGFAWARGSGSDLSRMFVRDATQFSSSDAVTLTADRPITLAIDFTDTSVLAITTSGVPESVQLRLTHPAAASVGTVEVNGEGVAFSTEDGALLIGIAPQSGVDVEDAKVPERAWLHTRPNPFREHTTVAFALSAPGPYRLDVYDVLGRRIRVLAQETAASGEQQVRWDGRNAAGANVPPGLYLVRLAEAASGRTAVFKVTRLP